MDAMNIADLFSEALYIVVLIVVIVILPSLLIGLVVATFQAATQINEQTLSFLPRLVVTLLMIIFSGPYLVGVVTDFTDSIFLNMAVLIG